MMTSLSLQRSLSSWGKLQQTNKAKLIDGDDKQHNHYSKVREAGDGGGDAGGLVMICPNYIGFMLRVHT